MADEQPFDCLDDQGRLLRGVQTGQPTGRDGRGLLLLNAGLLPRYGYHRHHVKGARLLAAQGVPVLRLDLPGMGDSAGELPEGPVEERWREIELGSMVPATLAAARAWRTQAGLAGVVLGGACGGAITALLAAAHDPAAIAGCLAVSLPICLSGTRRRRPDARPTPRDDDAPGPLHPQRARQLLAGYLPRLGSPTAWRRLLTGRSDLPGILRALRALLRQGSSARRAARGARPPADDRLNPLLVPALRTIVAARVPLRLVLGGLAPETDDFRRYLARPILEREPALAAGLQQHLVPRADHTFADPEDERLLWQEAASWIRLRCSPPGAP